MTNPDQQEHPGHALGVCKRCGLTVPNACQCEDADWNPDQQERVRPTCKSCGYADEATFTLRQLDVYDFRCPRCGSIYFDFPRARPWTNPDQQERCPTCESDDREVLLGECADRATRYGEGKRVRLRLVDPWHQHRETTQEAERLREALRQIEISDPPTSDHEDAKQFIQAVRKVARRALEDK